MSEEVSYLVQYHIRYGWKPLWLLHTGRHELEAQ